MHRELRSDGGRVTLVGPMPPPTNGQSVVFSHIVMEFRRHIRELRIVNTGDGESRGWVGLFLKLGRAVASCWAALQADATYVAVKAGYGMWLTTAVACFARLRGARIFLHHHSYAYVRRRQFRMVVLTRVAGRDAYHIVLSRLMDVQLRQVMPEIQRTLIVGNAALVDGSLVELPLKWERNLTLGHLSNLSAEKGIAEVVDLAVALKAEGIRAGLIIGGPAVDNESSEHIDRASRELGELFEYRGPLAGASKQRFFSDITHFAFPSRYEHEAMPLVLYEALAAGVVCIATRQGVIAEQLEGSPALLAENSASFVQDVLPALGDGRVSYSSALKCRETYLSALAESVGELEDLIETVKLGS